MKDSTARALPWLVGATALALAVIGAAGLAWKMELDTRAATLLVTLVAVLALLSSAIPVALLASERIRERRGEDDARRH